MITTVYIISDARYTQLLNSEKKLISTIYKSIINEYNTHSNIFFENVLNKKEILTIFAKAEKTPIVARKELYTKLLPIYENMNTFKLRQLHFHLKNNDSFLRFHRPEKFGDNLSNDRNTVKYVNENYLEISGFEEGKIFNGYRFVYPLNFNKVHIGSVEASISMQSIIKSLTKLLDAQIDFIINKEVVYKKVFKDELSNYEKYKGFPNHLISIDTNNLKISGEILSKFKNDFLNMDLNNVGPNQVQSFYKMINYKSYILSIINVKKALSDDSVAHLIVLREHSSLKYYIIQRNIITSLIIFLIGLILYFMHKSESKNILIKEQNKRLAKKEKRLQEVFDASEEGIWNWNLETNEVSHNNKWYEIIGYDKDSNMLEDFTKVIYHEDKDNVLKRMEDTINLITDSYYSEHRLICKDGRLIWVEDRGKVVEFNALGKPLRISGSFSNITKRKEKEKYLQESEAYNKALFNDSREALVVLNPDTGEYIDCNDAAVNIYGLDDKKTLLALTHLDVSDIVQYNGMESDILSKEYISTAMKTGACVFEWRHKRLDGELWDGKVHLMRLKKNEQTVLLASLMDITIQKETHKKLEYSAYYDALTNLPKRPLLLDRLDSAIAHSKRSKQLIAVVFIDLDGFKEANDTYGHSAGDEVLIVVSRRMQKALRESDTLARIGGDEFLAILTDLDCKEDYVHVLERLLISVSDPIPVDSDIINVTASIGVSIYPDAGLDADQLTRYADIAMYTAKKSGKNCYHIFEPELHIDPIISK